MPVLDAGGSDSAMLDNALEFLARCGRDPLHAMMTLIPEAPRAGRGRLSCPRYSSSPIS